MPDYLTPLEQAVIEAILRGVPSSEECFRFQLQNSRLDVREFNGYGFFTNIVVADEVPVCLPLNAQLPANALVSKQLCGFILWIANGKIDFLEGYPLGGDSWPEDESFEQIELNSSQQDS
jgi:hypothetical protein